MVPAAMRDFFTASASVAGALIGLLFVAITVASDRLAREERGSQLHRIRASATLTSFTNALVVSLFALLPGHVIGYTAVIVALIGLAFVTASMLSLVRLRQLKLRILRDGLFLIGLIVLFADQLMRGITVVLHPDDLSAVEQIAVAVAICFTFGIARAWELIGGPSIGIRREVTAFIQHGSAADGHGYVPLLDQPPGGEQPDSAEPPQDGPPP